MGNTSSKGAANPNANPNTAPAKPASDSECPLGFGGGWSSSGKNTNNNAADPSSAILTTSPNTETGKDKGKDKESKCPVPHEQRNRLYNIASNIKQKEQQSLSSESNQDQVVQDASKNSGGASACPVPEDKRQKLYDVYGQQLNPLNMMPTIPNQLPSPGQSTPLSTVREVSTIPKGAATPSVSAQVVEEKETWVYPSPQMFYNALKRKGKADDVREEDMDAVVQVHNNMNERTWGEVLRWEKRFHCDECASPSLLRFQGRPHDLSPIARLRTWMGQDAPFDRHDWIVDRCGDEVRYVIDYYYQEQPGNPIWIDVRPAMDSAGNLWDRIQNRAALTKEGLSSLLSSGSKDEAVAQTANATVATAAASAPPPSTPAATGVSSQRAKKLPPELDAVSDEKEFQFLTSLTSAKLSLIGEQVSKKCASSYSLVQQHCEIASQPQNANNEALVSACEKAQLALSYCLGSIVCPTAAEHFMQAMQSGSGNEADAYTRLTKCVDRFQVMATRVRKQEAGVVELGPEKVVLPGRAQA